MIEYFADQLKVYNSDKQLLQYMYDDGDVVLPAVTVHPDYAEVRGLEFVRYEGNVPVFKEKSNG